MVLVAAAEALVEAMAEAVELAELLMGFAEVVELIGTTVLVAVGAADDPPQFHQPPDAVTVTVCVSSTTLVTMYLLSNNGVANAIEARSGTAKLRLFIVSCKTIVSRTAILCGKTHVGKSLVNVWVYKNSLRRTRNEMRFDRRNLEHLKCSKE